MFTNNPFSDVKNNIKKQINEHIPLNDKEGEMAMSELNSVIEYANQILQMLKPETQMEAWVQSKITKAKDYLDSVADYLKHTDGALEESKHDYYNPRLKALDKDGSGKIDSSDFKKKFKKGKSNAKR